MNIPGYVLTENKTEKAKQNVDRYKEILADPSIKITIHKKPAYGRTYFYGTLDTPEAEKLSERDIALYADSGNLCFGGSCEIFGKHFNGYYWID